MPKTDLDAISCAAARTLELSADKYTVPTKRVDNELGSLLAWPIAGSKRRVCPGLLKSPVHRHSLSWRIDYSTMTTQPVVGNCKSTITSTIQASGTANGNSKSQALDRARAQAQTLLDAMMEQFTTCPGACPVKSVLPEPDFDSSAPVYSASPDVSVVFICTVAQGRVVTVQCSSEDTGSGTGASDSP